MCTRQTCVATDERARRQMASAPECVDVRICSDEVSISLSKYELITADEVHDVANVPLNQLLYEQLPAKQTELEVRVIMRAGHTEPG
jgi:hypothetical protein